MKIGIDITSCYSADSLYGPENEKDLFGDVCLTTIIDSMIFSDSLVFPLPSKKDEDPIYDPNFNAVSLRYKNIISFKLQ